MSHGAFRIVQNSAPKSRSKLQRIPRRRSEHLSRNHTSLPYPTDRLDKPSAGTWTWRATCARSRRIYQQRRSPSNPVCSAIQYLIAFNSSKKPFSSPLVPSLNAAVDRAALIRDVLQGRAPPRRTCGPNYWAYNKTIGPSISIRSSRLVAGCAGLRFPPKGGEPRTRLTLMPDPRELQHSRRIALNVRSTSTSLDVEFQVLPVQEVDPDSRGRFEHAS